MFKPLTSTVKSTELLDPEQEQKKKEAQEFHKQMNSESSAEIVKTTEERIRIIYDDSSSMSSVVDDKTAIELAAEATTDYMRNCKPKVTAIEVVPLNMEPLSFTKNLPKLAAEIKKINASGGTPLFGALGALVDAQPEKKYTRALIFTDGEAMDGRYMDQRPTLIKELKAMEIPIDFIIIGNRDASHLSSNERIIKDICETSGGTFLICKDGKAFKEKMKFFAPLLRHLLPSIASKGN